MYQHIFDHRTMLADHARMTAYQKAIHEVVRKGDVVADIGAGSGILAFFAVQAGASRVYAIEQGEVIHDAERLARINKLEEKIVFVHERSARAELPEKVDVITSELLGSFGLDEHVTRFVSDARTRFLKPGGKLIPSWLELYLVPGEWEAVWQNHIGLWRRDYYGVDLSPIKARAVSQRYSAECSGHAKLLADTSRVARIDLGEAKQAPSRLQGNAVITQPGIVHGLVGYFRAGLSPGVILSTAPDQPRTHWKQAFFPLSDEIKVEIGDEVRYKLKAISQMDALSWQWDTSVYRQGARIAEFSQSDLYISKEELVIGREDFQPQLLQKGEIARRVLNLCDGSRPIREIAAILQAEYPDKYASLKNALQGVVSILGPAVKVQ